METSLKGALAQLEERFGAQEHVIHAFVPEDERFARLRRDAEDLETRFPVENARPTCFGLMVGVKDIFHADGFDTHAGSRLPVEALKGAEAASVAALKKAGALVVGKTVTTEFAYFAPGPTRNPRNPDHTPGGSSSGSAAAVAAGLCTVALGTQTIGSIIRPAAFCGVVGLKPTHDRISREGVIPLSPSLDHVGCFAADVDTVQAAAPTVYLDWQGTPEKPARPVLGVPEGPYLDAAGAVALGNFRRVGDLLAEAGYELRGVPLFSDFAQVRARHDLIMSAEAAQVHERWFDEYKSLYSEKTYELIQRGRGVASAELAVALEERAAWRHDLEATMEREQIDLWISPAAPGPAPKGIESTGDPVMNLPWTQAGFPTIGVPSGVDEHGLPMGLQLTGRWRADEALLTWAHAMESIVSQA